MCSTMSCPSLAAISAAKAGGRSAVLTWSTCTATPLASPHSLTNWSNQTSWRGTKWLQRRIFRLVPEMLVVVGVCLKVAAPAPVRKNGVAAASASVAPAPASVEHRYAGRSHGAAGRDPSCRSFASEASSPPLHRHRRLMQGSNHLGRSVSSEHKTGQGRESGVGSQESRVRSRDGWQATLPTCRLADSPTRRLTIGHLSYRPASLLPANCDNRPMCANRRHHTVMWRSSVRRQRTCLPNAARSQAEIAFARGAAMNGGYTRWIDNLSVAMTDDGSRRGVLRLAGALGAGRFLAEASGTAATGRKTGKGKGKEKKASPSPNPNPSRPGRGRAATARAPRNRSGPATGTNQPLRVHLPLVRWGRQARVLHP